MSVAYSRGQGVHDARPEQRSVPSFEALVAALDADRAPTKDSAGYVCGPLNGDGRRHADGALPRRWLALDLDHIDADVLPDVRLWFARFSGSSWPTHSSKPEAPRERVLIELTRDATRTECIAIGATVARDLADKFGDAVQLDPSTHRGEQPVFLPPAGVTLARFLGDPLDVDRYLSAHRDRNQDAPERPTPSDRSAGKVGPGQRNEWLSREAYRLRKQGHTVEQITTALQALNTAMCDPPVADDEVATIARGKRAIDPNEQPRAWAVPLPIGADELAAARTAPRCIVDRYLWADVAALVAPGGSSKTTLSLHEFACIVLGRPVWGLQVLAPGPVLVITSEDRREYLVARLRHICEAMRLSPDEVATVRDQVRIHDCSADVRRLTAIVDDVVVVAALAHEIVDACQAAGFAPALVQFDPMVSFGVGEGRVNDAEQGLINAARVITAGLDCAVRYVHHTGVAKAIDKADHQYAGRGGSALADGCRMVHVLTTVDDAELYRATGEHLADDDMAVRLSRPKLSYAPPSQSPLYIRRRGYAFELLRALAPVSDEDRMRSVGEQLARFLQAEAVDGRRHSRNTLEQLRPDNLSRNEVRAGLAWLQARGAVHDAPVVGEDGKAPRQGARRHLVIVGAALANRRPWEQAA